MQKSLLAAVFVLWMSAPALAGEALQFDPEQPFQKALSKNLLHSFLNQALDQLEDHLEISGDVTPNGATNERRGHLRLKFYPEGKAKSDQPLTAEGWFRLAPDNTVQDLSLRFRNPETPKKNALRQSDGVL